MNEEKLNDYLQDMIGFLARCEEMSYEPEDQKKYRYAKNALEEIQKKVDAGEFA